MRSPAEERPVGIVADLWRFPVKSFGGERLRRAFVGPFGVLGDRRRAVVDAGTGEPLSARRASRLLGFRARYDETDAAEGATVETPGGMVLDADDPDLAAQVGAAVGRSVTMVRHPAGFHDAAALHVVSQASLAALGGLIDLEIDARRFRPNVVLETDDPRPFAEADWIGLRLAIGGGVVIEVQLPTERCAVTTFDPDSLERDTRVLWALARERDNLFGVYARVLATGRIAVGDAVRTSVEAPAAAGRG